MKQGEVAVRELLLSFDESWSWGAFLLENWHLHQLEMHIYTITQCIDAAPASGLLPKDEDWCPVYRPVPGLIDLKSNSNQNMAYIERIYMVTLMDPTCYTL